MHAKTKLALLRKLNERKRGAKGFTLVELMITVAVVGILSAVALPQYLRARDAAAAGAQIGEKLGLAKECATFAASGGVGVAPTNCTTAGGTFAGSWSNGVSGLRCLGASTTVSGTSVSVTVNSTGSISCSIT